mmetsp:Transcript_99445/g.310485  ORF Transcript_99445/g.310485 Transcript_99445/m.310485 type:complete len:370 (+) Transcript_99445:693-1802(+)
MLPRPPPSAAGASGGPPLRGAAAEAGCAPVDARVLLRLGASANSALRLEADWPAPSPSGAPASSSASPAELPASLAAVDAGRLATQGCERPLALALPRRRTGVCALSWQMDSLRRSGSALTLKATALASADRPSNGASQASGSGSSQLKTSRPCTPMAGNWPSLPPSRVCRSRYASSSGARAAALPPVPWFTAGNAGALLVRHSQSPCERPERVQEPCVPVSGGTARRAAASALSEAGSGHADGSCRCGLRCGSRAALQAGGRQRRGEAVQPVGVLPGRFGRRGLQGREVGREACGRAQESCCHQGSFARCNRRCSSGSALGRAPPTRAASMGSTVANARRTAVARARELATGPWLQGHGSTLRGRSKI